MHIGKCSHRQRGNGFFSASCQHGTGISTTNGFPGFAKRVCAGCTSRNSSPRWSLCASEERDHPWRGIDHHHGHQERTHTRRPFFLQNGELLVERHQSPHTTANADTNGGGQLFRDRE